MCYLSLLSCQSTTPTSPTRPSPANTTLPPPTFKTSFKCSPSDLDTVFGAVDVCTTKSSGSRSQQPKKSSQSIHQGLVPDSVLFPPAPDGGSEEDEGIAAGMRKSSSATTEPIPIGSSMGNERDFDIDVDSHQVKEIKKKS